MKDECLICGAPLKYLENDTEMECALCHKKENSKTACEKGHYVCNECHTGGIDSIIAVCLADTSKNPILILQKLWNYQLQKAVTSYMWKSITEWDTLKDLQYGSLE